jgi:hypothetical protein
MGNRKKEYYDDYYDDDDEDSPSFYRKRKEIVYLFQYKVELYARLDEEFSEDASTHKRRELIKQEVRRAVEKLSDDERIFIEKYYFEFKSYQEIAGILKKRIYKLERIHRRALDKMHSLLSDFVKEHFKLEVSQKSDCLICSSPFRQELDELIKNKKKEETYRRLIRIFKQEYGLDVKTPQVIIGHQRKHMI